MNEQHHTQTTGAYPPPPLPEPQAQQIEQESTNSAQSSRFPGTAFFRKHLNPKTLTAGGIVAAALTTATIVGVSAFGLTNPGSHTNTSVPVTSQTNAQEGSKNYRKTVAFTGDLSPLEVLAANKSYSSVKDTDWSAADAVPVKLSATGVEDPVSGVSASNGVVTISQGGVYRLQGTLNGQIAVNAPEDARVILMLDNANIRNASGSGIIVQSADDVELYLVEGSTNRVSDAGVYASDAQFHAAIDSQSDLAISGSGTLEVKGVDDGIASSDDLVIHSGTITVNAVDDGIVGKDALVVEDGILNVQAGGDALKSNQDSSDTAGYVLISQGSLDLVAGDDAIQGETDVVVTGGILQLDASDHGIVGGKIVSIGGGKINVSKSAEAIQSENVGIFEGTFDLHASDDGINASSDASNGEQDTGERIEISGGTIAIEAGGDGLDSNGSITVTGGKTTITSAARGGEMPIDANGSISIASGTVIANGVEYDPATARTPGGMGGGMNGMGGGMGGGRGGREGEMSGGGGFRGGGATGAVPPGERGTRVPGSTGESSGATRTRPGTGSSTAPGAGSGAPSTGRGTTGTTGFSTNANPSTDPSVDPSTIVSS